MILGMPVGHVRERLEGEFMHRATRARLTLILTIGAWLLVLPSAEAYIDPGSTTVIFQAIVAGLAAVGTGIAVFWTRMKSFFRRGTNSNAPSDSEPADAARPTE